MDIYRKEGSRGKTYSALAKGAAVGGCLVPRVPSISRIDLADRFLEFAFQILDVHRIGGDELDYRQACEKAGLQLHKQQCMRKEVQLTTIEISFPLLPI